MKITTSLKCIIITSLLLTSCTPGSLSPVDPEASAASQLRLSTGKDTEAQTKITPTPVVQKPKDPMVSESDLELIDRTVIMETNLGILHIEMLADAAPITTENFIRLVHRKYYDGIIFHRMVESPNMNIIQGGDPKGTGRGGESAFGKPFKDEIFTPDNPLEFRDPSLYPEYSTNITSYKKGYLAMANSGPDTNGSQFFVMLTDTKLPPKYTIFGKIDEKDFGVLEKIVSQVNPKGGNGDGIPDKELKIIKAVLE